MDSSRAWVWQHLRYDGLLWRRLAYLGSAHGPEWLKRYAPPAIAATIFVLVGRNRRGVINNMHRILGTASRSCARRAALRMFAEFAHCFSEAAEYYGPRPRAFRIEVRGRDILAKALSGGRGAVVITGHFGNWDVAAKELHELGRPINLVMAREANTTTNEDTRRAHEQAGVQVIYSDSSVFSSLNMIRALRRNEVVAIQLDRSADAHGIRHMPFFGAPAPFPSGPFVLARAAGAPLIPVFVPRLGTRTYQIRVCRCFTIARGVRDRRACDRIMLEVAQVFESMIQEFPTQWFQFRPFWNADALQDDGALRVPDDPLTERLRAQR